MDNIRTCIECGSTENKFYKFGKKCIKCYSRKNNQKQKEKNYHKQYYEKNKDDICEKSKQYYEEHTEEKKEKVKARRLALMPADYVVKSVGRPRKQKKDEIEL